MNLNTVLLTDEAVDKAMTAALVLNSRDRTKRELWGDTYRDVLDDLRDTFRSKEKVKASSGCYRTAFIFKGFVLKVSRCENNMKALITETDFINKHRADPTFGRHFPETHVFTLGDSTVQVQERISMSHAGRKDWLTKERVRRLAAQLGIDDVHDGNYGWKGSRDKKYPVFIDVDIRCPVSLRGKVRPWPFV